MQIETWMIFIVAAVGLLALVMSIAKDRLNHPTDGNSGEAQVRRSIRHRR